jgi:hypothetical protein
LFFRTALTIPKADRKTGEWRSYCAEWGRNILMPQFHWIQLS